MPTPPVNLVCMRWGDRYSVDFVHILRASVERHLRRPFRFICITEQPAVVDAAIETCPIPDNPGLMDYWWPNVFLKLVITRDGFAGLSGPTLFMDLDIVIMDSLDPFFDYHPGENCIIHNWVERRKQILRRRPDVGNSSLFRFDAGRSQYIYETFLREIEIAAKRAHYTTEQAFLTHAMVHKRYWPDAWVQSFKRHCHRTFPLNLILPPRRPPPTTKVLVFHGRPDPDVATTGWRAPKLRYCSLPAPWIAADWHT
jgi:hypothetical protein